MTGAWVTGEWAGGTAYQAVRVESDVSYGVTPYVTHHVADRIVADQELVRGALVEGGVDPAGVDVLAWASDDRTLVHVNGDRVAFVITPTDDGLYNVGFGWPWHKVDEDKLIGMDLVASEGPRWNVTVREYVDYHVTVPAMDAADALSRVNEHLIRYGDRNPEDVPGMVPVSTSSVMIMDAVQA